MYGPNSVWNVHTCPPIGTLPVLKTPSAADGKLVGVKMGMHRYGLHNRQLPGRPVVSFSDNCPKDKTLSPLIRRAARHMPPYTVAKMVCSLGVLVRPSDVLKSVAGGF